ncbi:DUF350 domain-containing protein [Synechococcus sp. PCC 7336]|uniref:DUF350 domain-containing protein n=1 Tax=Synechococcus sp. PCC 7336 TaxID=195250 RepID=UPI001D0D4E4D|nr:DUF350 domain-containing protein [Synechococcus sp. PCC 7336]
MEKETLAQGSASMVDCVRERLGGLGPVPILIQVISTIGWAVLAVLLCYGGVKLFDLLDPIDYRQEIERGNIAAAIVVAAVILALASIVIVSIAV